MNLTTGKPSTKHILDLDTLSRININQKLGDGGWRIEAIIVTNNDSLNASKHAFFIPAQSKASRPQPIAGRSASVQPQSNRGYEVPHQIPHPPPTSLVNRLEQEASANQYIHQKNAIENGLQQSLQQSHFRSRSVQYGKEYEIKVKTGEIKGAGTKAAIHVKFFGTGNNLEFKQLCYFSGKIFYSHIQNLNTIVSTFKSTF